MEHGLHAINDVSSTLHMPSNSGNIVITQLKNHYQMLQEIFIYIR
mgnify:CR=1 FL=1